MQLYRTIYYSIVPSLLNMFWTILSLIIRSFQTVITASDFTHVCRCPPLSWLSGNWVPTEPWQRPTTTNVSKTRSCNYSLETPDDVRYYRSKHVEQSRNNGIINFPIQLHLFGHFFKICVMMQGYMNVKHSKVPMWTVNETCRARFKVSTATFQKIDVIWR
jgi:hypothetical protein